MKSNTKKIVILLILGLVFPITLNNNFNFSVDKTTFNNLKTSSVYNGGIMIDGLATTNTTYSGNWTWAESQPWCYDDNGVYIIEDLTINASTSLTGSGIYILDSDNEYFIIRNCKVYDAGSGINDGGIKLEDTNNGTLTNNNCSNNVGNGIYLDNSYSNTVSGNTVNNNFLGIYLYECDYNIVSGNIANDNDYGIYIEISNDNTISGNTANENSQDGLYSYFCGYNNITENTANNNDANGIYFDGDDKYNVISGNTLSDNKYGINIGNSDNNTIYGNFFLTNGIHAMDNGTDNKWNSTTIGNYWDNWTSPDTTPLDGIVDVPYTYIGGTTGNIDHLPIAEDGAPSITINSPDPGDVFYSTVPSFNVRITDDYLDEMWYTIDGGLINYTFTANGTIDQTAWAALSEGPITITFYANDTLGNEASEDVIITKSIPPAGDDPTIVIVIVVVSIVGGVVVLAVVYLFMKKRGTP